LVELRRRMSNLIDENHCTAIRFGTDSERRHPRRHGRRSLTP
jgi:hypothetical protein